MLKNIIHRLKTCILDMNIVGNVKLFTHLQILWMYSDAVMWKIPQNLSVWCAFRNPISALAPAQTVSACLNFHVRKCNRAVKRSEGLVNILKSVFKMFYRYFKGLLQSHPHREAWVYCRCTLLASWLTQNVCFNRHLRFIRSVEVEWTPIMHHSSHAVAKLQSAWHTAPEFHTSVSHYHQEIWGKVLVWC